MENIKDLDKADFFTAAADYRPIAFWSLNHKLEKAEMSWQIKQMAEQRLSGFLLHARSGLLTPYLSQDWFDMIEHAVQEAKRYGLKAWLYDEDPYPSGVNGGRLLADHPEYKAMTLGVVQEEVTGPARLELDLPLRKLVLAVAVRLENQQIVEQIDLSGQIGTLRTSWQSNSRLSTYYPTTYSKATPHKRADAFQPFLRLDWQAPAGQWQIFVFYREYCGSFWLFDSYLDLLNPDAVQYFLDSVYEPYRQRFSAHFGKTIPGMFVDEPKFLSDPYPWTGTNSWSEDESRLQPFPWTDRLPQLFFEKLGYPIDQALIALCFDLADGNRLRRDFWELVQDQFNAGFPQMVRQWCTDNELLFIGHCSPEEDPIEQVHYTGSIMHFMRQLSIAGTDLITWQIGDASHPILDLGPRLAASVARQWQDGRALCETYGVMEWRLTLSDMVWVANWLFATGVNLIVLHALIYSIDGYRKMDAGPSEFYQMPWFFHLGEYSDYVSRLAGLLAEADPVADTALLYPLDSFMALRIIKTAESEYLRDLYCALFTRLRNDHVQFEFVDYRDFANAQVEAGQLVIGKRRYSRVIIPPLAVLAEDAGKTLALLEEKNVFVAAGQAPGFFSPTDYLPSFSGPLFTISGDKEAGFSFAGLAEISAKLQPELELSGEKAATIMLSQVKKENRSIFFLFNPENEDQEITCLPKGSLAGQDFFIYQPVNQKTYLPDRLGQAYSISLAAKSACFLIAGEAEQITTPLPVLTNSQELSGAWQFKPSSDNCLILDNWVLTGPDSLIPASEINYNLETNLVQPGLCQQHGIKTFPTELVYKTIVHLTTKPGRLRLVRELSALVGQVRVFVNGQLLDNWQKERIYDCNNLAADLTPYLDAQDRRLYRQGELTISVHIKAEDGTSGLLFPLHLLGDFTVRLNQQTCSGASLKAVEGEQILCTGSWTDQGYPHFSGSAAYSQEFVLASWDPSARYYLEFNTGGHVAEVLLNGKRAAIRLQDEAVELSGMIQQGKNELTIIVSNTLENLLYGARNASGILTPVQLLWGQSKSLTS